MKEIYIFNLLIHAVAIIVFFCAAIVLLKKKRVEGKLLIVGVMTMNTALAIVYFLSFLSDEDGRLPLWFDLMGLLSPIGYLVMAISVFMLAKSAVNWADECN